MALIPSRECGSCTACCRVLPIRTPELEKTSHVLCAKCREGIGCRIYETRPKLCREYFCGWRWLEALPEAWRPDESGVFVDRVKFRDGAAHEIPPHYNHAFMIQLLLLRPDAIEGHHFAEVVWTFVNAGIPVFLGACGPPGHQNALVFLNEAVKEAVIARDRPRVLAVIRQAAATAEAHRFVPLPQTGC
jgi:hypothetical protein